MDEDLDAGQEMVEELGLDPAAGIEDRQRFDLLRKWHEQDAQKERETKD